MRKHGNNHTIINLVKRTTMKEKTPRAIFASRIGMIAAAAGSAVGLGNIWRFPSETASGGGALFILVYLGCILFLGIPVLMAEFMVGRAAHANASRAFKHLAPKTPWHLVGMLGIVTGFLILGFYFVVCGWTLVYIIDSIRGALQNVQDVPGYFNSLVQDPTKQIIYTVIFTLLTAFFVMSGVKKGIEKSAKVLMPLLFLLLIVLAVRSVTLEGAIEGVKFLFKPSLDNMKPTIFLDAMGQSFFSLSIGMGAMLTYGSYFRRDVSLGKTAIQVALLDTLVAVLAGVVIFPSAFAINPDLTALMKGGPGLIFITLPGLFQQMPLSMLWSALFFILLAVAALTSAISILEPAAAYFHEEFHLSRRTGTLIATAGALVLGVLCCYSMRFFDALDFATAKFMLPLGGMLISLFVGWYLQRRVVEAELTNDGQHPVSRTVLSIYIFILRFVAPLAIFVIFLYELIAK